MRLRRIDFGSILITIHQGDVVDIETSTKMRLGDRAAQLAAHLRWFVSRSRGRLS
jgi:hypothetical protein